MSSHSPSLYSVADTNSRLNYAPTGAWTQSSSLCSYNDSTYYGTNTPGSSVLFQFNGTFVAVYGVVGSSGTNATFVLDGDKTSNYVAPVLAGPSLQPLYSSAADLPDGVHTLNITAGGDRTTFCLTSIEYTGYPETMPAKVTSHASAASSTSSAYAEPRRSLTPGVIAGIAVGSVAMLVVVLLAIWNVRRRTRRGRRPRKGVDIILDDMTDPPPPSLPSTDILRKFIAQHGGNLAVSHSNTTSSGPTSQGASSTVFTSVIILTPPVSVSSDNHNQNTAPAPSSR